MPAKVNKAVRWLDRHPRMGWYLAAYGCSIATIHFITDVFWHFVT